MHPHLLHARTAAWSLTAALAALEQAAKAAADDAIAGSRGDRDIGIPSQQFGRRYGLGGHGDPTASLALGAWAPGGPEPHAVLLGDLMRHLDGIAGFLPGALGQDPVSRIRQSIPAMPPEIARDIGAGLANLDRKARQHLGLPPDRQPIAGACPACCARGVLYVATCGPEEERTVVCANDRCLCIGPPNTRLPDAEREPGCPCGMPVRVEGVGHIWDHTAFGATRVLADAG